MCDFHHQINDRFEFPERLDLTPFLNKDKEGEEGGEEGGGGVDNRGNVYLLHSVLVHSGDVNAGHYYSYIKPQKGFVKAAAMAQKAREQKHANANNGGGKGQYFRFDDDEVGACACVCVCLYAY
jgi:ubiquitin carboxyl-terminal hydrolase 7